MADWQPCLFKVPDIKDKLTRVWEIQQDNHIDTICHVKEVYYQVSLGTLPLVFCYLERSSLYWPISGNQCKIGI